MFFVSMMAGAISGKYTDNSFLKLLFVVLAFFLPLALEHGLWVLVDNVCSFFKARSSHPRKNDKEHN